MKLFYILLPILIFSACSHKNSPSDTEKYKDQFSNDSFEYTGDYTWSFQLMGTEQTSIHTLSEDSILYEMKGRIHSTKYPIYKLSYDKKEQKWIGEDPNHLVYVLFFKEKTDSTITIYKRKCKEKGLEEALNFPYPAPDATEDHGWNIYALDGYSVEDILQVAGNFSHSDNPITVSDKSFVIDNKTCDKMSFHTGERRWVGKHDNQYVQVFFKSLEHPDKLELSIQLFSDLEALYHTKYHSIKDWKVYERK